MKYVGGTILLLIMLTITFSKWVIIAQFTINQKYITEKLCINKNKPRSCCHGKCFLAKQLDKDEKSDEQSLPQRGKENTSIQLFFCNENNDDAVTTAELTVVQSGEFSFAIQSFYTNCFRPPRNIA